MEPITLRYQLDPREVAAASFDHSPVVRASGNRTKLLGAAAIALGLLGVLASSSALLLLPVGVLIFGLGTRWSIVRRQTWILERTPFFTEPVTVDADQQGIRCATAHADQWFRWSNYDAAHNTAGGIALVARGGTSVRWIPARAFASADQQASWFSQARDGIGQARQPAPA